MSGSFRIDSSSGGYSVTIEQGLFESLQHDSDNTILIADEWFHERLTGMGLQALYLPAHESTKSLENIAPMVETLRAMGATRQSKFVALGGGVVQDVATFLTSIYMRGVKWRYLPTTLLSMVDSCIGGKSSINVGHLKNIVGTFHPPAELLIDPSLALSLSQEQMVSGLFEAAKICFCRGTESFDRYLSLEPSATMSMDSLRAVIELSLLSKKWFVEIDEFDRKERLVLNFGHTFGHAIESGSHFQIDHGTGVALGILCALEMGQLRGIQYSSVKRVQQLMLHLNSLLATLPELPEAMRASCRDTVLRSFQSDKKHGTSHYNVVLVSSEGDAELVSLPKGQQTMNLIEASFEKVLWRS